MKVKLSNCEVTLKDALTWGDQQKVKAAIMQGAKMSQKEGDQKNFDVSYDASAVIEGNYVTVEVTITEIKVNNKIIPYTREWHENLTPNDGNKLLDAVEKATKKKN